MLTKKVMAIVLAAAVCVATSASIAAAQGAAADKPAKPTYIGAAKCKMCHLAQHKVWAASKHAVAFAALKPEEQAKKECATCHAVGVEEKAGALAMAEQNVGCESCHGPGSQYGNKDVMNKAKFTADPEGMRKMWASMGLVKPTEATCKGCHNEKSPNFKPPFDFAKASTAIKHWKDKPAPAAATPAAGK